MALKISKSNSFKKYIQILIECNKLPVMTRILYHKAYHSVIYSYDDICYLLMSIKTIYSHTYSGKKATENESYGFWFFYCFKYPELRTLVEFKFQNELNKYSNGGS